MAMNAPAMPAAQDWQGFRATAAEYLYFRLPDGRITWHIVGKGQVGVIFRQREGWEPLLKYGAFQYGPDGVGNPFEHLLQFGGAHEFTVEHLIEMGWHLRPPKVATCGRVLSAQHPFHFNPDCYRGAGAVAHFPQLDGIALPKQASCEFCTSDVFFPTEKAVKQHVRVMHKDEIQNRMLSTGLAETLQSTLAKMGMKVPAYACGMCSERYDSVRGLTEHMTTHGIAQDEPPVPATPAPVAPVAVASVPAKRPRGRPFVKRAKADATPPYSPA